MKPGARVLDATAPTLIAVAADAPAYHLPEEAVLRLPCAATGPGLTSTPSSPLSTSAASSPYS